jgi:hypothetical protein
MQFTKQKAITVTTDDFIEKAAICYAAYAYKGKHYLIQAVYDSAPFNPREELGNTWTWQADGAGYSDENAMSLDAWRSMSKAERDKYIYYPLGLLRHSGDTLYVGSHNHWADPDGWDSGCIGVAYMAKAEAVSLWGEKRYTKRVRERALDGLKEEVAEMNEYLGGGAYGIMLTCLETEECDSCWGYYDGSECVSGNIQCFLPFDMSENKRNAIIKRLQWV